MLYWCHMIKAAGLAILVVSVLAAGGIAVAQSAPAAPPSGSSFQQRLSQRKSEQKVQLDEKQARRLERRCTRAQQTIRELQQSTTQLANRRNLIYDHIEGKIWTITGMLKIADADTFKLEEQLATYDKKTDGFETIMGYYRQTLDDLAVINCQADLIGFQALLNTARQYHSNLRSRSEDIRQYIVDQINPTLGEFVAEL